MCVWGGPADLAQAIWTVQTTRTSGELQRFLSKLHVYMIGLGERPGQDLEAAKKLTELGDTNVRAYREGLEGWKAAGDEVVA